MAHATPFVFLSAAHDSSTRVEGSGAFGGDRARLIGNYRLVSFESIDEKGASSRGSTTPDGVLLWERF